MPWTIIEKNLIIYFYRNIQQGIQKLKKAIWLKTFLIFVSLPWQHIVRECVLWYPVQIPFINCDTNTYVSFGVCLLFFRGITLLIQSLFLKNLPKTCFRCQDQSKAKIWQIFWRFEMMRFYSSIGEGADIESAT